jgi:hypothetical protein
VSGSLDVLPAATIFSYVEGLCNRTRLHSTLHFASPVTYKRDYDRLIAAA